MTRVSFLALCALLAAALVLGDDSDPTVSLKGVYDLTPDTFDKHVNGAAFALVEFYAPWCGHCKRMTGEYKTLGELVANDPRLKGRVVIAKVNADEHRSLGERFGVQGFPTIKWFKRGEKPSKDTATDYSGARSSDKFLEFISEALAKDTSFARVEELDAIVKDYLESEKDKLAAFVDSAKDKLSGLKGDAKANGDLYLKYLQSGVDKGKEYFAKERARLERMIASGNVEAKKLQEMQRKSSVLSAFVPEEEPAAS